MIRLKGEIVLRASDGSAHEQAERLFAVSLDLAVRQKALAWQLRTATSLAQLRHAQGRRSDARDLLRSTCSLFAESHDLHDLTVAREALDVIA